MTARLGLGLGLGVVGCGMAARPHARALVDLSDRIEVRGVFARNKERRLAFAEPYGFPVAASLDGLARDPGLDAVLILTPPDAREDIIEPFAERGLPILMEKPLERTVAAAERIVHRCERAGSALAVMFQHRFRAGSLKLRELIAGGTLGPLAWVRLDVPWWRDQSYYDAPGRGTLARDGGGVLISQAIHSLDLMLSLAGPLTGPVVEVRALAATTALHRMECEDLVAAGVRFASGAVGSVLATTAAFPGGSESLTFQFERAAAHLQSGTVTVNWWDGRQQSFGEAGGTGGGADPMDFPHDWHRALIADFVDAVRHGRPPAVTGRQALSVHRLIDALIVSSRSGRAVRIEEETES